MKIRLQRLMYLVATSIPMSALVLIATLPSGAQDPLSKPLSSAADELQQTQKALDQVRTKAKSLEAKAAGLEQDIVRIREDLVATARVVQYHELRLVRIEERIKKLDATQLKIRKTFERRRRQLGIVLAALQRMARTPPEALLARPAAPADTVRGAIALRATLSRLEDEAGKYRKDLDSLVGAREEAYRRHQEFNQEKKKLDEQRVRLRRLHGRKSRLRQRMVQETDLAARQAISLSKQAASLRELVNRLNARRVLYKAPKAGFTRNQHLEAQKIGKSDRTQYSSEEQDAKPLKKAPPAGFSGKSFNSQKGLIPYPVVGRVVARYGQAIAKGQTHKGLTLEAGKAAQVVAPYEGKVAFSGPFRSYGELLIIEHNGGYHTLLAGMAQIDVAVGQWILTGEPVGVMGRGGARKYGLYLEIRKNSQPVNPLPWLAKRKGKISG